METLMARTSVRYDFSEFSQPVDLRKEQVSDFIDRINEAENKEIIHNLSLNLRARMKRINARQPAIDGKSTNPFVLSAYSVLYGVKNLNQIDTIIAAAKIFSSIETAAGRVVEDVVPNVFGWEQVQTEGHTVLS